MPDAERQTLARLVGCDVDADGLAALARCVQSALHGDDESAVAELLVQLAGLDPGLGVAAIDDVGRDRRSAHRQAAWRVATRLPSALTAQVGSVAFVKELPTEPTVHQLIAGLQMGIDAAVRLAAAEGLAAMPLCIGHASTRDALVRQQLRDHVPAVLSACRHALAALQADDARWLVKALYEETAVIGDVTVLLDEVVFATDPSSAVLAALVAGVSAPQLSELATALQARAGAAAMAAVSDLLAASEPARRCRALDFMALLAAGSPADTVGAADLAIARLDDSDPAVCASALAALAAFDPGAGATHARQLLELPRGDCDAAVRAQAILVVATALPAADVSDWLAGWLRDDDEAVNGAAYQALLAAAPAAEPALLATIRTLLQGADWSLIRIGLQLAEATGSCALLPAVRGCLRNNLDDIRCQALSVFCALCPDSTRMAQAAVAVLSKNAGWRARQEAIRVLAANANRPELVERVLARLRDEDEDVRAAALKGAIPLVPVEKAAGLLADALRDPHPTGIKAALEQWSALHGTPPDLATLSAAIPRARGYRCCRRPADTQC
jgi:hypothetical protein